MTGEIAFYVDVQGDDGCEGSPERPFRTLHRAQEAVRARIAAGMDADVAVCVRGGIYELASALVFDERDSGRDGYRVIYRNAPGEKPILSGGRAITGWKPHEGGPVWKADVGNDNRFHTLYAEGRRIAKARFPERGYFETADGIEGSAGGLFCRDGDFPDGADLSHASAYIWPGEGEWNWFSETKPIGAADAGRRWLAFQSPAGWKVGAGSRYYLQGSLDFLKSPDRYHLDEETGMLYYWPPDGGKPADGAVCAPRLTRLIELSGTDAEHPLRQFALEGFALRMTDTFAEFRMPLENEEIAAQREGLVYANHARQVTIQGCEIAMSGSCGIYLDHYASQTTVAHNRLTDLGYCGIIASGFAPGQGDFASAEASDTNGGHAITNNIIERGGQLAGHGSGIALYQSGCNTIAHNRIAHMPRYGISMKGLRHKSMPPSLYGIPVTWENHWDFLHARHNRIAYNDISRVMEDSQDGGLIESWGVGLGNVIHGNRLHDSGIHFSFGFGIYLDDASDGFTVTHNVMHGLYASGGGRLWMLIFAKGIGNRICNNALVANPDAIAAIGTMEMAGEANKRVRVENNIVFDSGMPYYFVNWAPDRFEAADGNVYWNGGLPCLIGGELPLPAAGTDFRKRSLYAFEAWRKLENGRFDARTVLADPLFVNAAEGDYRLRPESPAYRLGWQDLELDRIGPQPSHAAAGTEAAGTND